jgi:hypothetical protein
MAGSFQVFRLWGATIRRLPCNTLHCNAARKVVTVCAQWARVVRSMTGLALLPGRRQPGWSRKLRPGGPFLLSELHAVARGATFFSMPMHGRS